MEEGSVKNLLPPRAGMGFTTQKQGGVEEGTVRIRQAGTGTI